MSKEAKKECRDDLAYTYSALKASPEEHRDGVSTEGEDPSLFNQFLDCSN
jgi:hypothetical protein